MQDADAFDQTRSLPSLSGLREESSSAPDDRAFGSWFIVIAGAPRLRIVWDGKERWIVVQREVGTHALGWSDVWMQRDAADVAPAVVVDQARLAAAGLT